MSERSKILVGIIVLVGGLMLLSGTHDQGVRFLAGAEIAASLVLIIVSARRLKST